MTSVELVVIAGEEATDIAWVSKERRAGMREMVDLEFRGESGAN
jgi:hypothetical protein